MLFPDGTQGPGKQGVAAGVTQPLPLVLLGKCMILVLATHSSEICERNSWFPKRDTCARESSKRSSHSSLLVPRDQQEGKDVTILAGKLI